MRADILIVGQGLAGTMLAWEFERAGIPFAIVDEGHATAATAAGAGIVNPITGRRLVKSWRFESLAPLAQSAYRHIERALGVPLWRDMRVRRLYADEQERFLGADPQRRTACAPFIQSVDASGWWIRSAARVDLDALLEGSRRRWLTSGVLRPGRIDGTPDQERYELVVDCRGAAVAGSPLFNFVPWEFSKGELLELDVEGLEQDLILNRRFWMVPRDARSALAGATHQPGLQDVRPTDDARTAIEAAMREILGPERRFRVTGQRAGVRVNAPDRRPIVGRHPEVRRVGLVNGLGAKGVLWAPMLARQWVEHLVSHRPFDAEVDVRRFWPVTTL